MKKILIPIITTASLAATVSPLLSSCGNGGWIEWDFLKKPYRNDNVKPLEYIQDFDPIPDAYKWLAQDQNNWAYDSILALCKAFEKQTEWTYHEMNGKIKIDSWNETTHALDFKLILNFSVENEGIVQKMIANITCKNIIYGIEYTGKYNLLSKLSWDSGTTDEQKKEFLASDDSGNWSIKGKCLFYIEHKDGNDVEEYKDDNCNYNKKTLNTIFEDENKWECLKESYDILYHPMYYLDNYNSDEKRA